MITRHDLTQWLFFTLCAITPALCAAENHPTVELGYDLAHNLPHAHRYDQGVIVDLSDVSAIKYLREQKNGWLYDFKHEGRSAALPQSIRADFWIPIPSEISSQALALDVVIAPLAKKQVMDVFVGGKKIKNINFSGEGWQSVRVEIPKDAVKAEISKVKLHFRHRPEVKGGGKSPAAIRAVRIGLTSAPQLPTDEAELSELLARGSSQSVKLGAGQGLDYYIVARNGATTLKGGLSGGPMEIWTQRDGEKPKKLQSLKAGQIDLKLSSSEGATRLMLRAGDQAVTLTGKIGGASAAKSPTIKAPKYVVFWLIDTLRADKLPFYQVGNSNGRAKVKTPHLSAFAKESVVFEPFYVQGNESKASHASLFTGMYPAQHGVYTHEAKLPESLTTIAEMFKAKKYHTAGFVSNGYVSDKWDFDQGFETFKNFIREGVANNARAVVKSARDFIKKRKGKPFYLYLGTSDPHVTYRQHKEFIGDYYTGEYTGRYQKNITGDELGNLKKKGPPSEKDQERIEALYENEIAFNDKYFGELVDTLKKEGIYDETLIIVSADHGDEFWEHGSCGHGHTLYQELISVPLMIRWPASLPKGTRFEAGADGVDLLPTLATLVGGSVAGELQGRDLSAQLSVKDAYPQATMASQGLEQFALTIGSAKVIYRGPGSMQAFDLKQDPKEQTDISQSHPITTLAAFDPLSLYLSRAASWQKSLFGAPNALSGSFPAGFPQ